MLTLERTMAVTLRVLQQLRRDRRFLVFSLIAPLIIIYLLKIFFDTFPSAFNVSQYIVPVAAFIIHFITYLLCAIVLVRERTAQTLARMFVNGYRRGEIIIGYLFAYILLATVQTLLVILALRWLFDLNYDLNTLFSLYLVIWSLAVISIALGIFISNFAHNEGQVFPFIPLIIVPSIFLSGFLVPFNRLPDWAQWVGHLVPLYYAIAIIRNVIAPGGTLWQDWNALLALPVYMVVVLLLASFTLKERD